MDDRIDVEHRQVRALIDDQFPQFSGLSIEAIKPGGWNNRSFRLGEGYVVRLPSAKRYEPQIKREKLGLCRLTSQPSVQLPSFYAIGQAGHGYPYSWSILHWVEGTPIDATAMITDPVFARDLGQYLGKLQKSPTPIDLLPGVDNFYRGGDLRVYETETLSALNQLEPQCQSSLLRIWEQALTCSWQSPPVWGHGDIAPGNLLTTKGRLTGVIDFGLMAVGDPACDLVIAWTHLDKTCRKEFESALPLRLDCWQRAMGWALWKAVIVLAGEAAPAEQTVVAKRVLDLLAEDQSFLQNNS